VGRIEQRPPAFSALKVAGQRAYDLARRGEAVDLKPRQVEVYELSIVRYAWQEVELHVRCGSGTYVRSLGRDIARAVGTQAVMSALRREAIGPFRAKDAVATDDLRADFIGQRLLPPVMALGDMPRIELNAEDALGLARGQAIADRWNVAAGEVAALDRQQRLLAILGISRDRLQPHKFFGD
jgi:tRNA pseudouridine55 synthase